jgi:hypothetical protein
VPELEATPQILRTGLSAAWPKAWENVKRGEKAIDKRGKM